MASSLMQVLQQWHQQKQTTEWVLCTIFNTQGSSYRKAGAMMMFSGFGHQYGLLSGGCLESDMLRHARAVMQTSQSKTLTYDANDEDDLTFQLGIGCGGVVQILLQPITVENQYLGLEALFSALQQRQSGIYTQHLPNSDKQTLITPFGEFLATQNLLPHQALISDVDQQRCIRINIKPEPHLLIAGGGYDARPLAEMAKALGWTVSVWDPRPANARKTFFPNVDHLLRMTTDELATFCREQQVSAAVIMAHSVDIDADVLRAIQTLPLDYLGLLGPQHRKQAVLQQANIAETALPQKLAGPIGLALGGDTPESIALAILAEIHAVNHDKSARSLSGIIGD